MDLIQKWLEKVLLPISNKLGNSKVLKAISSGMILTLPLTLGASVFLILASFPIPEVSQWLSDIGIATHLYAISGGTLGILALFVSFTVAYNYANLSNANGMIAGIFSLSSFMILAPQSIGEGETVYSGFLSSLLGNSGLFVALLVALVISQLYIMLSKNKRLVVKLPDSVPPMVSQSIEPLFVGLIIYSFVGIVRFGFASTSYLDIFNFVNEIIAAPLMSIGGSIPSLFLIYTVGNLLFFFGIHPASIYAIMQPITTGMMMTAADNIKNGAPIQYLDNLVTFDFINNDATGSTLSLLICILIFTKAKRYKAFSKISLGPNLFNINEPVIFGLPIMYNAILFVPFVFSSLVSGIMGFLAVKIGFITTYNASVALSMPWTLPKFISSFFVYGWQGVVLRIIVLVVMVMFYLPFVKILDKKELELEQEQELIK